MSTKNLRELIEMTEEAWPGRPINAVARKELDDIEKAAVEWVVSDHGEISERASDVMCAIANEVMARKERGT